MDPNPYDYELGTLKQLCRTANKTANRTTWRLAMLGRSVCVQVTIRGATSAVPGGVASRAPMGWVITTPASSKPAVTIESKTRGRTLEELGAAFSVRVHAPALVDMEHLRRVEVPGRVDVVVEESS